jgi:hypothetical protein
MPAIASAARPATSSINPALHVRDPCAYVGSIFARRRQGGARLVAAFLGFAHHILWVVVRIATGAAYLAAMVLGRDDRRDCNGKPEISADKSMRRFVKSNARQHAAAERSRRGGCGSITRACRERGRRTYA